MPSAAKILATTRCAPDVFDRRPSARLARLSVASVAWFRQASRFALRTQAQQNVLMLFQLQSVQTDPDAERATLAIHPREGARRTCGRPESGIGKVVPGCPAVEGQFRNQLSYMASDQSARTDMEQACRIRVTVANGSRPIQDHGRNCNPEPGRCAGLGIQMRRWSRYRPIGGYGKVSHKFCCPLNLPPEHFIICACCLYSTENRCLRVRMPRSLEYQKGLIMVVGNVGYEKTRRSKCAARL